MAAQRTLLIDSGSEADCNAYESYAAVRSVEGKEKGKSRMRNSEKGYWESMQRHREKAE